ncbi:trigger factor [Lachnotalea glycerini]|uniref:Trigger factor n=1 Tax=Lachnotalea glycerini TaxID=1763509 RepID=A0A318EQX8_9FIRM|nr:trigger factor [Lachnotalea glycerini]PXV89101.1 trigger factor [Lachnotalea glycerini]
MSLQVEKLEKNMAKLTIETSAEDFEKALQSAYQKNKNKFNVPGFRKGKVPRQMIEKMYGAGIFYEDAANEIIPEAYAKAADESKLDIVSQPDIDVTQIEKGKSFIFTAEVALKPDVTLGDYKGIEVEKAVIDVTEEEIDAEVDKEREKSSRVVVAPRRKKVKDGDITTIDFEGFVDGVAFEGGKGEDYSLTIGSHSFIEGFEEALIGVEIGEETDVNVTFPDNYQAEELAGKPAVFKVTVKEIKVKELPEADDDFAKDVSEFDTMAEYKADLKVKLEEKKVNEAKGAKEDAIIEKIIENATMDIPDAMIKTQVKRMVDDFSQRITSQGLSLEQYFQFTGLDQDKLTEQMKPQALKRIQSRLVLEAITKAENIEIKEEQLEKEIADMAAAYKMEVDKLKELIGDNEKEQMKSDIAVQEAVKLIVDASIEK